MQGPLEFESVEAPGTVMRYHSLVMSGKSWLKDASKGTPKTHKRSLQKGLVNPTLSGGPGLSSLWLRLLSLEQAWARERKEES